MTALSHKVYQFEYLIYDILLEHILRHKKVNYNQHHSQLNKLIWFRMVCVKFDNFQLFGLRIIQRFLTDKTLYVGYVYEILKKDFTKFDNDLSKMQIFSVNVN
jgi:hypothetical protein